MGMLLSLDVEALKPTKVAWRHFIAFFKHQVQFYTVEAKIFYDLFFSV